MDNQTQQLMQAIAIRKHQENRTMNTDYIEALSPEDSRTGLLWVRSLIGRIRKVKRRETVYTSGETALENC